MDDEARFRVACVMLIALLGVVGWGLSLGYSESVGEESTSVGYSLTAKLAWVAGGIGLLFIGWKMRERSQEIGYGILCIVPMVLFFALPPVLVNRVRVDREGFAERHWRFLWVHSTEVKFSQYSHLTYQVHRGRRGDDYQLVCRSGGTALNDQKVLGVGGLLRAALPAIAEYAGKRGGVTLNLDAH